MLATVTDSAPAVHPAFVALIMIGLVCAATVLLLGVGRALVERSPKVLLKRGAIGVGVLVVTLVVWAVARAVA